MLNVAAGTIHVGPRYEELSPGQKLAALVAAPGFAALMSEPIVPPPPDERVLKSAAVAVAALLFALSMIVMDFQNLGEFTGFSLLFLLLPVIAGGVALADDRSAKRARDAKPTALPFYVLGKDFVSTASEISPGAGYYLVTYLTLDEIVGTARLATDERGLVHVGDVGIATLVADPDLPDAADGGEVGLDGLRLDQRLAEAMPDAPGAADIGRGDLRSSELIDFRRLDPVRD